MLHIFKFTPDYFTMKANTMNSDQTSLIWAHIVCNIGYQSTKADEEQTTLAVNGRKMWLHVLGVSFTAKNMLGTSCFWCGSHWRQHDTYVQDIS